MRCRSLLSRALALGLLATSLAVRASHPLPPLSLAQRNTSGTALCAGCTTSQGPVADVTADSDPATCGGTYSLEIEVRPVGTAFSGVPTHTSATMQKASCVLVTYPWTRLTGLSSGVSYKWQVRERVNTSVGAWVQFNNNQVAFVGGNPPTYQMAFLTPSQTVGAGACSGITTVERRTQAGAPSPVASATPVVLGNSHPFVTYYSDSACTNAATQVNMPAGSAQASFWWRATLTINHSVYVDMQDAAGAAQSQTMVAGPPSILGFPIANPVLDIKLCSGAKQVQVQDTNGDPANNTTPVSVALTSDTGTSFFSDAACTVPASTLTIPAGSNTATFHARENEPGLSTWTAAATGLTSATTTQTAYGILAITTPAQTAVAGACAPGPLTIQARDGTGAPYLLPARLTVNLSGTGMSFHSASTCNGSGGTSTSIAAGTSDATVYWKGTRAGSVSILPSASYYRATGQVQTITPGAVSQIGFTTPLRTVTVAQCALLTTVATQDAYANLSPTAAARTVNLSGNLAGTTFHTDSACATAPITSVTVAASATSASFYWKSNTAGTLTLTAGSPGLTSGTQDHTVRARLVFTTAPQIITAGNCSTAITVQSQNGTGGPSPVNAATNVNLGTSLGGQFFDDALCTAGVTFVTIPNNGTQATLYYRNTRAGPATITASGTGLTAGSQVETIDPGPATRLGFTTPAQVVGRTLCSGVATVARQDDFGNATSTPSAAVTVTLTSTSPTMSFYSDALCTVPLAGNALTIAAGASSGGFRFIDTTVGSPTITATAAGHLDGTQAQTISLGAATRLAFSVNGTQTVAAGACSAQVTLQSRNASNNPENVIADTLVSLTSTSAGGAFYSDASCLNAISSVTLLNGTNATTFRWRDTAAGSPGHTASATGMVATTAAQTVTPAAPQRLVFATQEQTVAASACSEITTIVSADQYDNPSSVAAGAVVNLASSSPSGRFFSDPTCQAQVVSVTIPAGTREASFYWSDTQRGRPTFTAGASGLASGTQTQTVGGRDQVSFRWYGSTGAPLAGERVEPEVAAGTRLHLRLGILSDAFLWRLTQGDSLVQSETAPNAGTVSGTYLATQADDLAYQTLTETRVGTGQSAYRTLGDPLAAGSPDHVYSFGGLIPTGRPAYELCLLASTSGETLRIGWAASGIPATPAFPAGWDLIATTLAETCFDLKAQGYNGGPLTIYLRDALRGAGSDGTNDTFTIDRVYVRGNPPVYLALDRASLPDFSDAALVPLAELWDDLANVNGARVTSVLAGSDVAQVFVESQPSLPASQLDVGPGLEGEWDFTVTMPSTGGSFYYRLALTTAAGVRIGAVESVSRPAGVHTPATRLAFTAASQTAPAGSCTAATVERRDPAGFAIPSGVPVNVSLSASPALGVAFYAAAGCGGPAVTGVTIPAGQPSATFFWRSTVAGSTVLTASAAPLASGTLPATVTAGPPAAIAFTSPPQMLGAGSCSAFVELQVRDQYGNASPVAAAAGIALGSTSTGNAFRADAACGTALPGDTLTIPSGQSAGRYHFRDTVGGSPVHTASHATLGTATQQHTILAAAPSELRFTTAAQRVQAGACSAPATVTAYDSLGNPTTLAGGGTVALSGTTPTVRFFASADAACATPLAQVAIPAAGGQASFRFRETAAGAPQLTATLSGLTPANQAQVVDPAPAARVRFASAPHTVDAGACSPRVDLRTEDPYGNLSPVAAGEALILGGLSGGGGFFSDPGCATALMSPSIPAGSSAFSFHFRETVAGARTLSAQGMALAQDTQGQTVRPGPAAALAISGFPSPATSGVPGAFTVTARDAFANVATGYLGTVAFSSSDPLAALPGAFSFTAGNAGTGAFQATLRGAGVHSITVGEQSGALTATQSGIQVVAGPAAALALSGIASPIAPGVPADLAVVVQDAAGNLAASYLGTIRFTSSDPGATLPVSYTFTGADQGRRTFVGGVRFGTAGTHSVTAVDVAAPGVTGTLGGIRVLKTQGMACGADAECGTSLCVDGVCCNAACSGACDACDVPGLVGTCSPRPDGSPCANATYCDGAEVCRAGACSPGTPVSCVDPDGLQPLVCSEAQRACVEQPDVAPLIVQDGNPIASVGLPYRYNDRGGVTVRGSRPVTFERCAGPPELRVDPATGQISWTPAAPGTVPVCLRASNASGVDQYQLTVTVEAAPAGAEPVAVLAAAPLEGMAPLTVQYDGRASTADPLVGMVGQEWDFGNWSPLAYGPSTSATFLVPGGLHSSLTVHDGAGRSASARAGIRVLDAQGRRPPLASIAAPVVRGTDSLSAALSCNCAPGDQPITAVHWDFGDGSAADGPAVTHTFQPGRYHVQLTAVDASGLVAVDTVEVAVARGAQQPPRCRLFLRDPAGPAPLTARVRPVYSDPDGMVVSAALTFEDGSQATGVDVPRTYAAAGRWRVRLEVVDDAGLTCADEAEAVALSPSGDPPPSFLSAPPRGATCGVEWVGPAPVVSGEGPRTFSLRGYGPEPVPEGMAVDARTGAVRWLPSSRVTGTHRAVLRVETPAGAAEQVVTVEVQCGPPQQYDAGCCSAGGPGAAWIPLLAMLVLWLQRAQRNPRLLKRAVGRQALRLAVRFSSGSAFQAPPRATFSSPDSGPRGSRSGERG